MSFQELIEEMLIIFSLLYVGSVPFPPTMSFYPSNQQTAQPLPRLYKSRLFEILDGRPCTSQQTMTYDEFSHRVREYLVQNNHMVAGQPRYLHIKLNHESMFELTGLCGDRTYTLIDNWSQIRTWDDFLHFLQRRWAI